MEDCPDFVDSALWKVDALAEVVDGDRTGPVLLLGTADATNTNAAAAGALIPDLENTTQARETIESCIKGQQESLRYFLKNVVDEHTHRKKEVEPPYRGLLADSFDRDSGETKFVCAEGRALAARKRATETVKKNFFFHC